MLKFQITNTRVKKSAIAFESSNSDKTKKASLFTCQQLTQPISCKFEKRSTKQALNINVTQINLTVFFTYHFI